MRNSIFIIMLASYVASGCGTAKFAGDSGRKKTSETAPIDNRPDGTPDPSATPTTPAGPVVNVNDREIEFGSDKVFRIGDNDFGASSCRRELKAFDLSGTRYFFEFEVVNPDTVVTVEIRRICGVDYDETNFVRMQKDGAVLSEQRLVSGSASFAVGSQTLQAGKYSVVVESLPNQGDNDDFIVGNIYLKGSKQIVGLGVRTE